MTVLKNGIMGLIGFDCLRIRCIIGVNPDERNREQDLFVTLRARVNFSQCLQHDNIDDTVCYAKLSELCAKMAVEGEYLLLETYAVRLLSEILARFPVSWCRIKIEKPEALPDANAAVVELEMER